MTLTRQRLKYLTHPGTFCLALLILMLYMVVRDTGLYPTIMGDEWTYSSFARLTPYRDTLIPSYLYYSLYGLTKQCGTGFLACSQLINAVLFVSAAPFIYLVARRVASGPVAAVVGLVAVAGPANSYTGYFMPEAMYFCAFWAFSALVFWFLDQRSTRRLVWTGVALGLLAMVKVHALFLVPAYCTFLFYAAWAGRDDQGAPHWWRWRCAWPVAICLPAPMAWACSGRCMASRPASTRKGSAAFTRRWTMHAGT
jgi:phosphoglycerol transferase